MTNPRPLPTQEELLKHVRYDAETGFLWWLKAEKNKSILKPAGARQYKSKTGEPNGIGIMLNYRQYRAHRIIWQIMTGKDPGALTVDHINRNPFDNRWENLRLANGSLQIRNQKNRGRSQYKGVYFHLGKQKWQASAWIDGKRKFLGLFKVEEDAGAAAAPYFIH